METAGKRWTKNTQNVGLIDNAGMRLKRFEWLTDTWEWLLSLDRFETRLAVAAIVAIAVMTYSFWFVMLPIFLLAGLVVAWLHFSRPKDSL